MDNPTNPQNPQQVPQGNTTPPDPSSKITLSDLYGPSGMADANTAPQPLQNPPPQPQPVPEEPVQVPDLPLRKQPVTQTVPEAEMSKPTPESIPQQDPKDIPPKRGVNKVFILRFLFGAIGLALCIVLVMFAVTFLSSIFHPSTAGRVTLTYWGLWEDSNTMQSVISKFQAEHPDIVVNYEKEDPKDYSQRLLTHIQQGNGPDIFMYHSSWMPMVKPILVPLPTSVVSKNDLQNNFYPVVSRDLVKNGAFYGVPLGIDTLSLFVNNTLFKNAKADVPTSWDAFSSTARALTEKDGNGKIKVAGAAIGTYDNITHAPDLVSLLFAQNGVDIPTLTPASNASDALSFYTSFATGDSKVWDSTLDPSQLGFIKGNVAMYFGYSWDVFAIKAANPTLDFSVYPVPHLPERNTTIASYWVGGVSNKSLHQKEALLFMQFLAQKNTAALLYAEESKTRLFGEPYAREDLGETLKVNVLVYPFVLQGKDATSSFFAGETFDTGLNGQMNGYLGNAVRSILANTSPESAVDTLTQGVKQIENQYGSD